MKLLAAVHVATFIVAVAIATDVIGALSSYVHALCLTLHTAMYLCKLMLTTGPPGLVCPLLAADSCEAAEPNVHGDETPYKQIVVVSLLLIPQKRNLHKICCVIISPNGPTDT